MYNIKIIKSVVFCIMVFLITFFLLSHKKGEKKPLKTSTMSQVKDLMKDIT